MKLVPPRPHPICFTIETLEGRTFLSGSAVALDVASLAQPSAIVVAAKPVAKAATKTTLTVTSATLAQPVVFTLTVAAAAAAGAPTGSVSIFDHGKLLQSVTLSPTASTNPKFALSSATYTLTQQHGGSLYYFGKHPFTAKFVPSGSFLKSTAAGSFTVIQPTYTKLSDGVQTATVTPGSGAAIASGQTAIVFYTGFLARSGKIFDDSIKDGGSPFKFVLGAGSVITGFDEGTAGMQVGETRAIFIPPAEGYGPVRNGPIPVNSTLIFVITLEAIA